MDSEAVAQNMRLYLMAYLHIFVCKSTLEGRNQSSSIFHVLIQSVQQFVRCRIKGRYHNCLVLIQILRFRPYKITFHIHSIQSVVHPAHYIIVADSTVSGCPRCLVLDTKPFQCSKCFIAHKHCHIIFFSDLPDALQDGQTHFQLCRLPGKSHFPGNHD